MKNDKNIWALAECGKKGNLSHKASLIVCVWGEYTTDERKNERSERMCDRLRSGAPINTIDSTGDPKINTLVG